MQDGRREADTLDRFASTAVTQLHPPHLDGADPGLNQALRTVAVPDDALATIWQLLAVHRGRERFGFRLDSLGKQATRATPQNRRQRSSVSSG